MTKREALEEALHNAREDYLDAKANMELAEVSIDALVLALVSAESAVARVVASEVMALEAALDELHAQLRPNIQLVPEPAPAEAPHEASGLGVWQSGDGSAGYIRADGTVGKLEKRFGEWVTEDDAQPDLQMVAEQADADAFAANVNAKLQAAFPDTGGELDTAFNGYGDLRQPAFDGTGYLEEQAADQQWLQNAAEQYAATEADERKPDLIDDTLPLDLTLESGETGGAFEPAVLDAPEPDAGIFETLRDIQPEPPLDLAPTAEEQRLLDALDAQKEPA